MKESILVNPEILDLISLDFEIIESNDLCVNMDKDIGNDRFITLYIYGINEYYLSLYEFQYYKGNVALYSNEITDIKHLKNAINWLIKKYGK